MPCYSGLSSGGSLSDQVLDWKQIHRDTIVADLHIHPAMQLMLFRRNLNLRFVIGRTFKPSLIDVLASFPRLRDGGYGVIFMPYWLMPKESGQGVNFISRHIQYLVDVGGEDVVGLGTDFDGFATPPDDLDNASQMSRLTQRLVIDGHSADRIKKILGGNAVRALREGWGRKN